MKTSKPVREDKCMIDGAKFTHDPNVPGFQDLIEEFSEVVAGRIEHDSFMVGWDKASEDARIEFKKFMKKFQEVTAAHSKCLAAGESDDS